MFIKPSAPATHPGVCLRLLAPNGSLGTLREAEVIARSARNRGIVRRLRTIFYDTADRELFADGLSLRVQRQGRRFTQILRGHGAREAAAPAWACEVDGPLPQIASFGTALPAELLDRLAAAPLTAVFEARLRRQLCRLDLSGALVDAAFDEGVIEAASGEQHFAAVRLVLRSGEASVLYDVGLSLLELAPLRVDPASTLRRGYALASGAKPKAVRAAPSAVTGSHGVDGLMGAVLGACQAHLHANQPVAEDGRGAEGVHQMRVALRRLRTAFSLLHREMPAATMLGLAEEAKWLADQLGPARGWDVFLATIRGGPDTLDVPGANFEGLRRAAEGLRADAYETVREAIGSARYGRFQMVLARWVARCGWREEVDGNALGVLAEPASALAARVLRRLQRRARRQGRRFATLSATQRHALRITLKKLRYAVEFFEPLCAEPASAARLVARVSALQEALGHDHDAVATQPLLEQLADGDQPSGIHQAIGVVAGWQGRDVIATAPLLAKRWRRFKSLPPLAEAM